MSISHGKDGVINNGANAIAKVISYSTQETQAFAESTVMGDSHVQRVAGVNDSQGSLEVIYDPDDTNGQVTLTIGATIASLILYPQGNTSGLPRVTFTNAIISSRALEVVSDDMVKMSIDFVASQAPTWDTVP